MTFKVGCSLISSCMKILAMAQWVHVLGVAVLRVGLPSTMLVIYAVKQLWAKSGVHEFVQKSDMSHALAVISLPVIAFLTQILPQRHVSTQCSIFVVVVVFIKFLTYIHHMFGTNHATCRCEFH